MPINNCKGALCLVLFYILLSGCYKEESNFYPDEENPGLSIFSNNANNVMSCIVQGKPFRTVTRSVSVFSGRNLEVYIRRQQTNTQHDTLSFQWIITNPLELGNYGELTLQLPVAKNFSYHDFSALQGKRINVGVNGGYFTTALPLPNFNNAKGTGMIYFNIARLDSIGPNLFEGNFAGLFEADFNTFKVEKGRFDHAIIPELVSF